jgi:predicted PurR-regulated permease PerM
MPYTFARSDIAGPRVVAPGSAAEIAILASLIVGALYFGQAVLVPLALAIILSFVLAPAVRLLRRTGLPNAPAVFVVVVVALAIICSLGTLLTQQVGHLAQEIPRYQLILKDKVKTLTGAAVSSGGALARASDVLEALQKEMGKPEIKREPKNESQESAPSASPLSGATAQPTDHPVPVEVHYPEPTPLDHLQKIAGAALAPLATTGLVIVFVLFLLLQRGDVRDRAIRLFGSSDLEKSTAAMDDAGERLSRYFLALTAINAAYGCVIGAALWLIGVPSPLLWGALAMVMRMVPFVGWFIAAICPLLLAAAVDSGWTMLLWTLALFVGTEPIMGNVIEPIVQGNRTGLSPLAIILSAAFWTLLWGPIGLLLAIPLTLVLVVLGRHVERLEFLNVILGDTPPLTPPQRFYQRMLAGDPAEAIEQAEKFLKEHTIVEYYDAVVIEGLRIAQSDVDRGTLEPERLTEIHDTSEFVIDALNEAEMVPKKSKRAQAETDAAKAEAAAVSAEDEADEDDKDNEKDSFTPLKPKAIAEDWRRDSPILCVASRTPLDETAAMALAQLLTKCGLDATVITVPENKRGGLIAEQLEGVRAICLTSLDVRERSAHARFLARRLRRSAPQTPLIGGFFTLDPRAKRDRDLVETIPVDELAYSLRDALKLFLRLANPDGPALTMRKPGPRLIEAVPPCPEARQAFDPQDRPA